MGRAENSFTSWVGKTAEIEGERVTLPEKDLWVAVLTRAVLDACKGPPHLDLKSSSNISHKNHWTYNQYQAQHFFLSGSRHFQLVCEMAGRDPRYVQRKIRKILLQKNGWNVDVPITSRYRQGPKRSRKPQKKHLTGNAYYAARTGKRGRPRIYNGI